MKAKEVMQLLKISRITLYNYTKEGKIKGTKLHNGYYDYDSKSVYKLLGKSDRFNVIYSRVSSSKQKHDLKRQTEKLEKYCKKNNIEIKKIYQDISSGIDFERDDFSEMLNEIFDKKIDTVYITYTDRLTRLSFTTLKSIFSKFGTSIEVICSDKNKNDDLFDDLTSLMYHFSTKKYSKRKNN